MEHMDLKSAAVICKHVSICRYPEAVPEAAGVIESSSEVCTSRCDVSEAVLWTTWADTLTGQRIIK